jgi:replicative DNA helicase
MSDVELATRLVCCSAGVSLRDVRGGFISAAAENDLADAQEYLAKAPMFIDESFNLSMPEIRAKSRRLKERYDIEAVVVDYLQLIQTDTRIDRHEAIGQISRGLKALARELDIPVIALAQLNRGIEQRRGKQQRPVLSDLRESGSIEQDADLVMFIQRDFMFDMAKQSERAEESAHMSDEDKHRAYDVEEATLIIAKNRSGPTDDVKLAFRKSCTRFEPKTSLSEAQRHGESFRG